MKIINNEMLKKHFEECKNIIVNLPSPGDYRKMMYNIQRDNYLQIYYEFGIMYLLVILNWMENIEEYIECSKIYKCVKNINKVQGKNLPTRL